MMNRQLLWFLAAILNKNIYRVEAQTQDSQQEW